MMTMEDFFNQLPEGYWFLAEQDLWLRQDEDLWQVGANSMMTSLGKFMVFYPKPDLSVLSEGDSLGVMETWKTAFGIASPFGCSIVSSNSAVVKDIGLAVSYPYTDGWLFRLRATDSFNPLNRFKTRDQYIEWLQGPGAGQFSHLYPRDDPDELIYDPLRGI